ncbi:hypothetical protein HDE76_002761 [Rhodanobacter sp. ANJX3]|uniref:DUF6776 family protein n=1 Tax=unclassified Rhodanobacter TaxID=2621553 RepID=UPI0015CE8499|nr:MULTISPECIES: DUF6776 family protein [unclassified Rhodanobacter]MBB5359532.1 hypothetical protein [Rhodanobacter sp. ANJX3]NYE30020.1 hypothetical protein [Rhodanobacter sp. K2T2]
MVSRPPPRFVVRRHDDVSAKRLQLWLAAAWIGSLLVTGLLVGLLSHHADPVAVDHRQQRALNAQIENLKQQLANAQRDAQVNDVATKSLRVTLTQREEEISGLRANLGFYSRLVGGDTQHQGLKLQEAKLEPISGSHGWNLMLSLMQAAKRNDEITGTVTVSVEGLRDNKVVQLDWAALGNVAEKDGLPFRLMYFEQLHGTIVLPANFRPMRLHIGIQSAGEASVMQTVSWEDALSGNIITAQGDHDAQP